MKMKISQKDQVTLDALPSGKKIQMLVMVGITRPELKAQLSDYKGDRERWKAARIVEINEHKQNFFQQTGLISKLSDVIPGFENAEPDTQYLLELSLEQINKICEIEEISSVTVCREEDEENCLCDEDNTD